MGRPRHPARGGGPMSRLYSELDAGHHDYALVSLPGISWEQVRGPVPDLDAPFVACFGGAQTFGRFTDAPYPSLLQRHLGLPCLNLGIGGAGPRCALLPEVSAILRRARLVVVQFCSGRSASCSLFDNRAGGRNYGLYLPTQTRMTYDAFRDQLRRRNDTELTTRVVAEMREDYCHAMAKIPASLGVPCVALWLSHRRAADGWGPDQSGMYVYPQLVNQQMVDLIAPHYQGIAECVANDARPQRLWQGPVAIDGTTRGEDGYLYNSYYPKPEEHVRAAERLAELCGPLLARNRTQGSIS
jgi:hypothetical protein